MRINHNISALKSNYQLNKNDTKMAKSLERLTSGLKINSAADDAAGMAISEKMRTQIAGLNKASNNASDGISVIQTAEGALDEVEACLQRMRELAVQAANGTYTLEDRQSIQQEIDALNQEINRISEATEFNSKKLLDGTIDRKSYSDNSNVTVISASDAVASGNSYSITVNEKAEQAIVTGNLMGTGSTADKKITEAQAGHININGEEIDIKAGDSYEQVFQKIRETATNNNLYCFGVTDPPAADYEGDLAGYAPVEFDINGGQSLVFISQNFGAEEEVSVLCDNEDLAGLLGLSTTEMKDFGKNAEVSIDKSNKIGGFQATATVTVSGNRVTVTDNNGFEMQMAIKPGTKGDSNITVLGTGPMSLHIGANAYQTMDVTIPAVTSETLGIENISMTTQKGAQKALSQVSDAIARVSSIRSKLGAYQNRLEHAISNLETSDLNMNESLSRIEDTDMAGEMATYTQYNVLVQAGTSMLAQANEKPQQILSLLQ
ncbi:MAG: flagellin [Lachnospiraceae bacterium]|nr:flagellin [Lachnospiraceae bacterium]